MENKNYEEIETKQKSLIGDIWRDKSLNGLAMSFVTDKRLPKQEQETRIVCKRKRKRPRKLWTRPEQVKLQGRKEGC